MLEIDFFAARGGVVCKARLVGNPTSFPPFSVPSRARDHPMKFSYSLAIAALFVVTTISSASAALVSTTLTLTNLSAGDNLLSIELVDVVTVDDRDLSGSVAVDIDIDSSGNISSFAFTGGTIEIANFFENFNLDIFAATITGTDLRATPYSNATSAVDGLGDFDASNSGADLDAGTITVSAPAASFLQTVDFAVTPTAFDITSGIGNIVSALTLNPGEYEITLNLPIAASASAGGLTANLSGGLTAVGLVVVTIPEPTSGAFLACLLAGTGATVRRRRN